MYDFNPLTNTYIRMCDHPKEYIDRANAGVCHPCNKGKDGIESCSECVTHNWGLTVECTACEEGLEPSSELNLCVASNCDSLHPNDPTQCETCESGFYKMQNSKKCVEKCPDHMVLNETLNMCLDNC